jgi:hypothetical protein
MSRKKSNKALAFGSRKLRTILGEMTPASEHAPCVDPARSAADWFEWLERYGGESAPLKAALGTLSKLK